MFYDDEEKAMRDFEKYVSPGKSKIYKLLGFDFIPGKREGSRIWSLDGKRSFLNLRSSGGVFNLGHRPSDMIDALKRAADSLDIGDHLLLSGARAALAKRMAELTPGDIQYTVFGVSGGEAIDLAIKLARAVTMRPEIVSAIGGYHGHTGFALATGDEEFKKYFGPLAPGFEQITFGDIKALDKAVTDKTAAVIFETIPATVGMLIPPDDYYPAVRRICDERGAALILDEVQAGLMRTGKMWCIDHWGVVPDILVTAKGLAGAMYPMSATCFRPKIQAFLDEHPFIHISTMGGSELGCAVTMAMLDRLTASGFADHVNAMAKKFADGFAGIKSRYPKILTEIRQKGLMIGLKMSDNKFGTLAVMSLVKRGMLSMFAHNDPSVLQIMPPLTISAEEVEEVLTALEGAYNDLEQFV